MDKKHLYRFRKINERTIKNIRNNILGFSIGETFNDPFDTTSKIPTIFKAASYIKFLKYVDPSATEEEIKQKAILIWESLDPAHEHHNIMTKTINDSAIERLDAFLRESYVACMNIDYKVPLMWSHYADSHKGICLKFNKEILINDPMIISSGQVEYNNSPIDIFKALIQNDEIPFKEYFYKKSCDWKYEKEYRLISATRREVDTNDSMYLDQKHNNKALEGIIFGAKCRATEMLNIINKTEHLDIEYSRVELSSTEYCCTEEIPVTKKQVRDVLEKSMLHKFS